MPHKFNDANRDKFDKARYRVTNASDYNESFRRRGVLMVWVADDVARDWSSPCRKIRRGQPVYSDLEIEICLTLRVVFRLPLRQTQGFMRSIAKLMDLDLVVPDYSTLSRRGKGLKIVQQRQASDKPITLIVDSTGLQMHGGTNWCTEKHSSKKPRKTWCKLHIGLDPDTGDIVASGLTTEYVGDEMALPGLLAKADVEVERFLADGAYDGQGVYECLVAKYGPDIELIIPPPENSVLGVSLKRDKHIKDIATHGRMKWQTDIGYNQRSLIEAQMRRWKAVIGGSLQARNFDIQVCEISIGSKVLNCMTGLGRAQYERIL